MDIQLITASSSGQATVNTPGSVGGGAGGFAQLLAGHSSLVGETEASETALTLAGLLQMLQNLNVPLQQVQMVQAEGNSQTELSGLLLQAMNNDGALADQLLQDAGLQAWFAQASDILSALGKADKGLHPVLDSQATITNLQAQNTLLLLTSMLEAQPNNPFLQHLASSLEQVMQPLLPMLSQSLLHKDKPEGVNMLNAVTLEGDSSGAGENGFVPKDKALDDATKQMLVLKNTEADVTHASKSKLDLLAAKHVISASILQGQLAEAVNSSEMIPVKALADSDAAPVMEANPAGQGLAEMLKVPQTEQAAKTAPAMISAQHFAKEMTEHVLKNIKITLSEAISEAKLSLFPKHLGHVDVKITMHEGQLIAHFAADTLAGKQMLESQLSALRQALQSQGLQVEKLEVTQNQSMSSGMFQEHRQQQQSRQSSQPNKSNALNYNQVAADFIQELSGAAPVKNNGFGNSFDVTA